MTVARKKALVTVQSSTVELGEALPAHAQACVQRVAGKYWPMKKALRDDKPLGPDGAALLHEGLRMGKRALPC